MILKTFKKNIIFFISLIFFGSLFLFPDSASAEVYNSLVTIPGITSGTGVTGYLSGLYNFLISVVGLVAMGAIVIGGARYLTSAGNPSAIEDAKHTIYQAIYGLLLALTSWVIIKEINPDVLVLKNPAVRMSGSAYGKGAFNPQCAYPGGPNTTGTSIPCSCMDGNNNVFAAASVPPAVVSTVPTPCSPSVSKNIPQITITFSDPMDPLSVSWNIVPAVTSTSSISADNTMAITTLTAPLANNTDYTVTVAGTSKRLSDGVSMGANYVFKFTTNSSFAVACTPPPINSYGSFCNRVCGNASLAKDGLYHCLRADLRVGTSAYPTGKEIPQIKVGDALYFDARSYSADYAYPGLNLKPNPYIKNSGFENGVDRYEICFDGACAWLGPNYSCSEPGIFASCSILNVLGFGVAAMSFWGVCGLDYYDSTSAFYPYSAAGTYRVTLKVRSRTDCTTEAVDDSVIITVKP